MRQCSAATINLTVRFLACEPDLSFGKDPDYEDEAESFYDDPEAWLEREYKGRTESLPTYVLMYDVLLPRLRLFLALNGYEPMSEHFHSHLSEGRIGRSVLVFAKEDRI